MLPADIPNKFYFELEHQDSGYLAVTEVKDWILEQVWAKWYRCEHQYKCYDGYLSYWQSVVLYDATLAVHFKLRWSDSIIKEFHS